MKKMKFFGGIIFLCQVVVFIGGAEKKMPLGFSPLKDQDSERHSG